MKFDKRLILILILTLGFIFRLYRFDNPIADWHSWRQADTSSVSRNFAKDGFDILHPRMDNISNVQSGLENPQGYFFVEFPIYNATQAALYKYLGILTLEEWGRLVTIIVSTLGAFFLYLIVSRHSNKTIGLIATAFYTFIPFDIYYGRTILADTSMVMARLGAIYFFDLWLDSYKNSRSQNFWMYLLAIVFAAAAFLLKPVALFFVLPMVYLAWKKFGWKLVLRWEIWVFTIASVAPLIWWRMWMVKYPEGIPANEWLFNGNKIRFKPSFFRWILYERLTKLLLGYLGIIIFVYGLYCFRKIKEWMFFLSFLASTIIYVCVIATGNVQHDYYQIPIMPSIAIVCAFGSYYLYQWSIKKFPIGKIVLLILLSGGLYFSWMQIRDFFNINNPSIIIAGEAIDRMTPKDAKVIADYNGDSSFLYQTKRKGWASLEKPIPDMVDLGASYLVLVNPTKNDYAFAKDYKIVVATKEYLLYHLENKKKKSL